MPVFQRVVVATDFSEASARAIDLAVAMAREPGVELHVLHVCEIPVYADWAPSVDLITPLTATAEERLDQLLSSLRASSPGAKGLLKVGVAWEQILAAAAEVRADLVVLGTHGRRGVAHAVMGSVAERVVRLSEIPVLTVRSSAGTGRREGSR
jgi:nucleotide-binding universal stress UspA family protein